MDHLTDPEVVSLPRRLLCHPQEGLDPLSACKMLLCGKYMPLRSLLHREFWFWANLQACLPGRALLKVAMSLKPKHPVSFLDFISSHLRQCSPVLALLFFHQKEAILLSINLQIEIGILKIDMAYWGMAWTTDLIRISFLAFENRFSFHPSSYISTLELIHENICFSVSPQSEGIP